MYSSFVIFLMFVIIMNYYPVYNNYDFLVDVYVIFLNACNFILKYYDIYRAESYYYIYTIVIYILSFLIGKQIIVFYINYK